MRHLLDGIAARINTISQLHRILSSGNASDGVISLRPHLHDVTDALVAALSSGEQSVKVVHTGDDCLVMMRQVQPIVLILCEIFINAHEIRPSQRCAADPDGGLQHDPGRTADADHHAMMAWACRKASTPNGGGLGFKVMRSLAAEIGAHLDIRSTHLGLSFRLSLPGGRNGGRQAGLTHSAGSFAASLVDGRRPV